MKLSSYKQPYNDNNKPSHSGFGRGTFTNNLHQYDYPIAPSTYQHFTRYPSMPQYYQHNRFNQPQPQPSGSGPPQKQGWQNRNKHQNYPKNRDKQPNQNQGQEQKSTNQTENKIYTCPGCNLYYDCLMRGNRYGGRIPLVLHCQHTVCQDCVQKGFAESLIICPTCHTSADVTNRTANNIQDIFLPNFHLFGYIMWNKPAGKETNKLALVPVKKSLNSGKIDKKNDFLASNAEMCTFPSCTKQAEVICKECNDIYCTGCSSAVHSSGQMLRDHQVMPISTLNYTVELERCREHPEMLLEYKCLECDLFQCCYCFLARHKTHDQENLTQLVASELEEVEELKTEAEQILKQLLISQMRIKRVSVSTSSLTEQKLSSFFADLHAQFYAMEKNLREEMGNAPSSVKTKGLGTISCHINASINNIKNVLNCLQGVVPNKKINMKYALERLRNINEVPCYLLCENEDDSDSNASTLDINPVLYSASNLIKIKKSEPAKYKLLAVDDLPEDYVKDDSEVLLENDAESCVSLLLKPQSTSTEDSDQGAKSKTNGQRYSNSSSEKKMITDHLKTIDNENVEVTHIDSMDCFYVQLKKNQWKLNQMNKDIDQYINMGASTVQNPEINELYLVLHASKKEKNWYRGRLLNIKPSVQGALYEVFFIDYGSKQKVDISKLRSIAPSLTYRKPFALQCEIYNPTCASALWSKDAHLYMAKIISGKEVFMVQKQLHDDVFSVDLLVSASDQGLTSIYDLLIYSVKKALSGSDSESVSSKKKVSDSFSNDVKIFPNSVKFRKNQEVHVTLANVVDPHHIFVHIADQVESFEKMSKMLKYHYRQSSESCIPIEGTYVIVEYRDLIRGNWHRAVVKKVDVNTSKAQVLLCDWGSNVVVPWANVRLLAESFTQLESQAVLVKLAHVEPRQHRPEWSEQSIVFLRKNLLSRQVLKMIVSNVDSLEVALFEVEPSVDLCINAQLVRENLADSTGKISQTVEWSRGTGQATDMSQDISLAASLLARAEESEDDSQEEETDYKEVVKQQVTVVKVKGPDSIYVKFAFKEEEEGKLTKELQILYGDEASRQLQDEWQAGDLCVVNFCNRYSRGKIIAKTDVSTRYKIDLFDRAQEAILHVGNIFVYHDHFRKYIKMAFEVRLANIRPAGGDKWSLSSKESLEKIFDNYKDIYLTKVEENENGKLSFLVRMWYTKVKVGDALEPSVTKFVSINDKLVRLGYAYRTQSTVPKALSSAKSATESECSSNGGKKSQGSTVSGASSRSENRTLRDDVSLTPSWSALVEEEEMKSNRKQSPVQADVKDWLPAFRLEEDEFEATITCAETEGILYLREANFHDAYWEMERAIKEYFDESTNKKAMNHKWKKGDLCTIAYCKKYYRGKVLSMNGAKEVVVIMIDFGSDHTVPASDLYREILYTEIPAFASRVKLDKIYAKTGAWLTSDYEMLMTVVTETGRVVIKDRSDPDLPLAEVYSDKGVSINDLLVKKCRNLTRSPIKQNDKSTDEDGAVIVEEESFEFGKEEKEKPKEIPEENPKIEISDDENDDESTVGDVDFRYEPLTEKRLNERTKMAIASVIASDTIVVKPERGYSDRFFDLGNRIQKEARKRPLLDDMKVGAPCIALYSEDNNWYRAKVFDFDLEEDLSVVLFVDFGNVEMVARGNVRKMKRSWFDVPVPCTEARLNFTIQSENQAQYVLNHLKKLEGKERLVEVVSEKPLVVELFEESGELSYKFFVDKGWLRVD